MMGNYLTNNRILLNRNVKAMHSTVKRRQLMNTETIHNIQVRYSSKKTPAAIAESVEVMPRIHINRAPPPPDLLDNQPDEGFLFRIWRPFRVIGNAIDNHAEQVQNAERDLDQIARENGDLGEGGYFDGDGFD